VSKIESMFELNILVSPVYWVWICLVANFANISKRKILRNTNSNVQERISIRSCGQL